MSGTSNAASGVPASSASPPGGHAMQDTSSGGGNSNLAHVAQGQIMQAAMNSNGAQNMQQQQQQNMQQNMQQQQPPLSMDLASVLAKIQSLEKEKSDMRAQLDSASAKLSKLQESKRAEMEQMMNSTINKWLENLSTTDAGAKEQLKDGLNRLVQSGDESGVWNVIACASSSWVTNVNQIETLTTQLNEYREKERLLSGGIFQSEESRAAAIPSLGEKRKLDGMSQAHGGTSGMPGDLWSEFQTMLMGQGGNMGYDAGILVGGSRGGVDGSGAGQMRM